ncbi:hypothetical protein Taro_026383, partial [Colocasia esculenta]|nr:hypothetical protein [Colocasia esculenta]
MAEGPPGLRILLHKHVKERASVHVSSHADRDRIIEIFKNALSHPGQPANFALQAVQEAIKPQPELFGRGKLVMLRTCNQLLRRLSKVVSFPAGSECELQESVAAVAGCTWFERGCWFARAAVGLVVGLRVY